MVDPLWDKYWIYCARCFDVIHRIIWPLLSLITHPTFAEQEEFLLYFSVQALLRIFVLQFLGQIPRWCASLDLSVRKEFFLADHLPSVYSAAVSGEGNSASRHVLCICWSKTGSRLNGTCMPLHNEWIWPLFHETTVLKTATGPKFSSAGKRNYNQVRCSFEDALRDLIEGSDKGFDGGDAVWKDTYNC